MPKDRGVVDLRQHDASQRTYVDPSLVGMDPRAAAATAAMAARRRPLAPPLPRYTEPTAGGPPPPIPALDSPHQEGRTMAEQAMRTMGADSARVQATAFGQHAQRPGSILAPGGAPLGSQGGPEPQRLAILPTDILPQEAMKDPNYHHGASSQLAVNQPHMAAKYGVVRGGQLLPPQALMAGGAGVMQQAPAPNDFRSMRRPAAEMQADLSALAAAQQRQQPSQAEGVVEDIDTPLVPPERPGAAAAATTGANPVVTDADRARMSDEVKRAISQMDDIDFDMLRRKMAEDILKNPEQRRIVEARCIPLKIEDLILSNRVKQRVPIVPGKFEPTYESQTSDVEMALKQLISVESDSVRVSEAYLLDKYALMNTTAGVVAINGNLLPPMFDAAGEFSSELFWVKYKWMLKRPMHMLASLGVHYAWFEARVRELFKVEEAKNG